MLLRSHLNGTQNFNEKLSCDLSKVLLIAPWKEGDLWMKNSMREIEMYYIDVVAVETSIYNPDQFQIYRIDIPNMKIVPFNNILFHTRNDATEYIKKYNFLQLSMVMLQEELRRLRIYYGQQR
mgnify:FL=1